MQNGQTPLHFASVNGHTDAVVALINAKATADVKTKVMPRGGCGEDHRCKFISCAITMTDDRLDRSDGGVEICNYYGQRDWGVCVFAQVVAKRRVSVSSNQVPYFRGWAGKGLLMHASGNRREGEDVSYKKIMYG